MRPKAASVLARYDDEGELVLLDPARLLDPTRERCAYAARPVRTKFSQPPEPA